MAEQVEVPVTVHIEGATPEVLARLRELDGVGEVTTHDLGQSRMPDAASIEATMVTITAVAGSATAMVAAIDKLFEKLKGLAADTGVTAWIEHRRHRVAVADAGEAEATDLAASARPAAG